MPEAASDSLFHITTPISLTSSMANKKDQKALIVDIRIMGNNSNSI
jgi:hypothetical protein